MNEITENTEMNYPPQMLAHEEELVLEDIKSRLENQNLDFETYLKLRDTDEETFMEEEVRPVAEQRLERSLVMDALIEAEGIKLDQDMLKEQINDVMTEVFYSGNAKEMQEQMGKEEFSRAISMEGVQRTINTQLQERLKLIATGQPIPEEEEETEGEEASKENENASDVEEISEEETESEQAEVADEEEAVENKQTLEEHEEENSGE